MPRGAGDSISCKSVYKCYRPGFFTFAGLPVLPYRRHSSTCQADPKMPHFQIEMEIPFLPSVMET